jgi:chloramphenicol O-acetyltransferase type B
MGDCNGMLVPQTRDLFNDDPNVTVGEFTYGCPVVKRYDAPARLNIGKFCSIADGVTIWLGGNGHHMEWVSTYPFPYVWKGLERFRQPAVTRGDVNIGHDVWIGLGATIMSGITIGTGSVIGTRSVVTHDVPPYAVVAGSPASVRRYRFDPETIEYLLAMQWWCWTEEEIRESMGWLCKKPKKK